MRKFLLLSAILFFVFPASAQSGYPSVWPGQSGDPVGFAASPFWTGSFNATACGTPTSGSSWATATIIHDCTYSSPVTISCAYCEFLHVDFNGGSSFSMDATGNHILFDGDRFQSNDVAGSNVGVTGANVYFFYSSFTPLVSFYISPPGTGCSESTPGNLNCTNWPGAGQGTNLGSLVEETGYTPGSTTPSNANAVNGNKGYQYGINDSSTGAPLVVDSCDFWGFGNAISIVSSTAQITVTNNWIHDPAYPGEQSYHSDGLGYLNGGTAPDNILMVGNSHGGLPGTTTPYTTQELALQTATGGYQNIYVTENFFTGWAATTSWCLPNSGSPGVSLCTNSQFYGNLFSTVMMNGGNNYGPPSSMGSGTVWACNRVTVVSGTTWSNQDGWTPSSGQNGYYWIYSSNSNPTSSTDVGGNAYCGISSPADIDFGNQQQGTNSATKTVTFTNTNAGTLSISSVSLATGTQFSVVSNGCGSTLAAGASCNITVKFAPTALGPATDNLEIADNTSGVTTPQLVPLSGTGCSNGSTGCSGAASAPTAPGTFGGFAKNLDWMVPTVKSP